MLLEPSPQISHIMEYPPSILDSYNFCPLIALTTFCTFYLNNWYLLKRLTPASASNTAHQRWKWRNIANSFTHSLATGVGACLCFWHAPQMRENLITEFSHSSHFLVSFSIGYFIYDMIDMAIYEKSRKHELLFHHFLVILCFSVSVLQKKYLGYALMALLLEVNSIFLHLRQLMIIQQWKKSSIIYRINNTFNLGTFVVFRFLTLGWMTRWLVQHRSDLETFTLYLAAVSLAVIMTMNIALLQRILNSDYRQRPNHGSSETMMKVR